MESASSKPIEGMLLNPRDIELSLFSSRQTLELGEPWEILLEIRNHSHLTVWVADISTTLTLPAEIIHPAENKVQSKGAGLPTVSGQGFDSVSISPGGNYICRWRLNEDKKELDARTSIWDRASWHVFFHPGKYDIQGNIHFWTSAPQMDKLAGPIVFTRKAMGKLLETLADEYIANASATPNGGSVGSNRALIIAKLSDDIPDRRLQQMATQGPENFDHSLEAKEIQAQVLDRSVPLVAKGTIEVTAKSSTVLVASAFGGVLAFLFRELYLLTQAPALLGWIDFAVLPSYILTAIIITLFLSRISEARFPLTIRIMDFWGATTLGILSALGGNASVKWIFDLVFAR